MQHSISARIIHQIYRPILHGLCIYLLLSTAIQSSLSLPTTPRPQNRVDNTTEVLMSVVQEAFNTSSLTSLDSSNLTSSLTDRLVQIIQEKGITLSQQCLPQTSEYLQDLFKADINLAHVTLISINMTRTGCTERVFIAAPEDPVKTTDIGYFSEFSDDYFPRFSVGVKCSSTCDSTDTESDCECTSQEGSYRLLKRMSGCGADGREVWVRESMTRAITSSCTCSPASNDYR